MKKLKTICKQSLAIVILAVTVANSFIYPESTYAALKGTGQTKLENFIYATGAYECLRAFSTDAYGGIIEKNINIGDDISNIFADSNDKNTYVGSWVDGADSEGMLSCKTIMSKMLASTRSGSGGSKITQADINSGILKDAYKMANVQSDEVYCNYKIVNDNGTNYLDGTYTWPQGYVDADDGEYYANHSKSQKVGIVIKNNQINELTNISSDMSPYAQEEAIEWYGGTSVSDFKDMCKQIVANVRVWPNGTGDSNPRANYAEVSSKMSGDPFGGKSSAWHAILFGEGFSASRGTSTSANAAQRINNEKDAIAKIQSNIEKEFFNGKDPIVFSSTDKSIEYMLMGRYLFNGDGAGGSNCGGLSVEDSSENQEKLDNDKWNTGLSTIAATSAYGNSGTEKINYRTYISEPGKSIIVWPWQYNGGIATETTLCYDSSGSGNLVSKFNGLTLSASDNVSRAVVQGYISPMTAEEANAAISTTPGATQIEDTCYNSGGAGAVAWIVCPILEWVQDASEDIYNTYVEPALEINPSLFSQDKDEGTRYAWGVFQGFANTIFIILILAVIFSQLTGVGIDNYGIKKILPKLIVAAILINLSYLICLICVDLSNILGNAFQELFGSLGVGADSVSISGGSIPVSGGSGGAITAVVILGVIGGVIVWRNPAILLTLLVSALGVLISIFFLFLLLSARQAAIIILTVLSPLAFVCYILPNTKKFFDRWFKIWEGLLLLFPICGLLIGGGDYASRLLLHALANGEQDLLGAFTAMLVGIAPIFFIPTVLRGSLTALGNLGTTISGVGNRLRAGTTKGIRNSEGYKNAQKMGQERRMRYKAGYSEKKGGLTAIGRAKANFARRLPGRLIGMNKRQAAYVEAAKKNVAISEESGAVLAAETAAVGIAKHIKKNPDATPKDYFWDQIAKAGEDVRKLNSIILAAEKRGIKKKDIAAGIRNAVNSGALTFANVQSQSNWMNSVLQDHGDIMSTDYELQEWTRKGGVGALGVYGAYAATNIDASDVDISDYSKMSGVSLAAMIKAGKVSASMAQQWLAANPNASADKKIMMGAVASGAISGGFAVSAEDFKSEAEALANGTTPATKTISSGVEANRPSDTLSDLVDSWTSTAQVRAYVSQDPSSIKPGQRQKDPVDVRIQHGP